MHLNLLTMLPTDLRKKLDDEYAIIIQVKPHERFQLWPRLRPLVYQFTDEQIVRQAAMQYLAYHQCIVSNVIFGLSLCPSSSAGGLLTSRTLAERHLSRGIKGIYKFRQVVDFSWLTEQRKEFWQHCCLTYLLYAYRSDYWNDAAVTFAESQCDPEVFKGIA